MKKKYGFTLIEILVVIAIIVLLAALLLPVLANVKERGRKTICLNNLKQIMVAYEMFSEDNFEKYPQKPEEIYNGIYPNFIKTPRTFWCPSTISRRIRPPNLIDDTNWDISYSFVFGLTTSNNCPNPVPVISDNGVFMNLEVNYQQKYGNHDDGINVQYLDGSTMWIPKPKIVYYKKDVNNGPGEDEVIKRVNVACPETWPPGVSKFIDIKADGVESKWGE